jgi:hypothetical protein
MRVRVRWICLPLMLGLLLPPAVAHGQAREEASEDGDKRARELFLKGDRAYAEGDYETALSSFEAAYALSGRHALLYNMANAHERLGQYDQALDKLRRFLPHASSGQQGLLEKRMQALQMRIDDQAATKKAAPVPPSTPPEADSERAEKGNETAGSPPVSSPPYLGYALVGVGAVGLGLGTYFGMQALDARSDAEDGCPDVGGARRCTTESQDAIDRDRSNALMADVSIGLGVVAAAAGVWMILSHEPPAREGGTGARVGAAPRVGGGEVDVFFRF